MRTGSDCLERPRPPPVSSYVPAATRRAGAAPRTLAPSRGPAARASYYRPAAYWTASSSKCVLRRPPRARPPQRGEADDEAVRRLPVRALLARLVSTPSAPAHRDGESFPRCFAILCASLPSIVVTTGNKKPGASWASGFRLAGAEGRLHRVSRGGNPAAVALLTMLPGSACRARRALADVRRLRVQGARTRGAPGAGRSIANAYRHVVMLLSSAKPRTPDGGARMRMPASPGWRNNQEGSYAAFRLFRHPTGGKSSGRRGYCVVHHRRN